MAADTPPAFDPSQPFQAVDHVAPAPPPFDPSRPFQTAADGKLPWEMSNAEKQAFTHQPPRTQWEDIQQGISQGAGKGAAGILGMPVDLWNLLSHGGKWAVTKAAEKTGLIDPETGAALRANHSEQIGPGSSSWIFDHLQNLSAKMGNDTTPARTVPGQYAETITSFLPLAASSVATGGGSAAQMLARTPGALLKQGVLPGAASETAGQLTTGTDLEPWARAAGAMVPGVAKMGLWAAQRALSPVKRMMDGLTPAQEQAAQQLLDESRAAGAPLTTAEAIQHVTGNGTRVGDIQRVVEQSPEGSAVMRPFMAARPGQVETLGRGMMDEIAPAGGNPYEIAPRVQGAAQAAIDASPQAQELRQTTSLLGPTTTAEEAGNVIRPELQGIYDRREGMRNALADADYRAARAADSGPNGAAANPVQVRPVINAIDDMLKAAKGASAAALRRARQTLFTDGVPDMSVTGLSNARNAISDQISSATRAGNNQVARLLTTVQEQLDNALEQVPAYGQARRNFARGSEPLAPFEENTAPGSILDRNQYRRNYTMPTERVAPTIERGGASSADQFLAAAENSPAAREAFGRYYSQQLLGAATNPAGRVNADVLANLLIQNTDMLRRFPQIAHNLSRVEVARRALDQLERTPLGALAQSVGKTGKEQFSAQKALLFDPTASLAGGENVIGNTVRAIARNDANAAQSFVRQHVEQAFNEATQNNLPGANQWGAPKFAAVVAGNTQQARNLEAAIRALPDGDLRWNAFRKGLNIMEGMGTRQPVGSQTAFNGQIQQWMAQGHPAGEFLAAAASPGRWPSLVNRVYRHVMFDRNTGELARVFTEGSVADLKTIARSGTRSFQGQAAMVAAFARQGALF